MNLPTRLRVPAVRDLLSQGSAAYVASLLMFVRALVLAAILDPAQLGVVALVSLLASLAQYADLGAGIAMEQRLPELEDRRHELRAVQRTGYLGRLAGSLLFSLGVLTWLTFFGVTSHDLIIGMGAAAVLFPTQAVQFSQQSYLRGTRNFSLLARLSVAYSVANLALAALAGALFGFVGVIVGQVIVTVAVVIYGAWHGAPFRSGWSDRKTATSLLRLGWPLTLLAIAQYFLIYVDQMLAGAWFGPAALGTYSLVTGFGVMLYFVPMSVAAVVAPRLLRAHADRPGIETLTHYGWRPTEMLRTVMPALVGGSWLTVWALFTYILPAYADPGLPTSYINLVAIYFLAVNLGPNATLIALRKHPWNVPIISIALIVKLVVDWFLVVILDGGLTALAWGSVASFALYLTLHLGLVARQLSDSRFVHVRASFYGLWPGAVLLMMAVVALSEWSTFSVIPPVMVAVSGALLSAGLWFANRSFAPVGIFGKVRS